MSVMQFPVFIDLTNRNILVVGGGTIAERRIHTLREFAGQITVVAPELSAHIREMEKSSETIRILQKCFEPSDLDGMQMVLAATDDKALNETICQLCNEKMIPVNVCSDQTLCDFQFPSIVKNGDVVIGINAAGKNHRLVKETRQKIEAFLNVSKENSFYK